MRILLNINPIKIELRETDKQLEIVVFILYTK